MSTELMCLTHMSYHPEAAGLIEWWNHQQKVQLFYHLGNDTVWDTGMLFIGCSMCFKSEANWQFHPSYIQNIQVCN